MTNRHLCLRKLFQFHGFYIPKTREYRSMSISTIFIYLFKEDTIATFILSLGVSWYFKSHKSPSLAFWTTIEMEIRKALSLPHFTMELSWVTQKPSWLWTSNKEESAAIHDLDHRGRSFWRNGAWWVGTSEIDSSGKSALLLIIDLLELSIQKCKEAAKH